MLPFSAPSQGALGNEIRRHLRVEIAGTRRIPDDNVAESPGLGKRCVVVAHAGRAQQGQVLARDAGKRDVGVVDFPMPQMRVQFVEPVVVLRVVGNFVTISQRLENEFRRRRHVHAHIEKRGGNPLAPQRLQNLRSAFPMRPIVEGEANFRQAAIAVPEKRLIGQIKVIAAIPMIPVNRIEGLAPTDVPMLVVPERPRAKKQRQQRTQNTALCRAKEKAGQRGGGA